MFSLRETSSFSSLGTDEDSFGWWIGVESHTALETKTPSQEPASVSSESMASCAGSDDVPVAVCALSHDLSARRNDSRLQQIELRSLEAGPRQEADGDPDCARRERRGLCYTPECLVQSLKYRILAPPPRNGAAHLADLLQRSRDTAAASSGGGRCRCRVRYRVGEGLLHSRRCPKATRDAPPLDSGEPSPLLRGHAGRPQRPLPSSEYGSCYGESAAEDTSGVSSGDEDFSSVHHGDQSRPDDAGPCTRLSSLAYASFEGSAQALASYEGKPLVNDVVSILANLEVEPHRADELLADADRFRDTTQCGHDPLARLVLAIEPDELPSPELEIEQLRGRLENLQESNRQLYEEISSLKRDFTQDEWRVNHLSEEVNKLRSEVNEQRFMDDLLKLLKGELERISNRNWPFVIGHTKQGTEEINLIV